MRTEGAVVNNNDPVMGRAATKAKTVLRYAILLIVSIILISPVVGVSATPQSVFAIESVQAARNIVDDGDFFLAVTYDITYSGGQPDKPVSEYFHFKLLSPDGNTLIGSTTPYPYQNNGYNMGIFVFYFGADEAPTWGEEYIIRIDINPLYYEGDDITISYSMTESDYSPFTTSSDNRALLRDYFIDVCLALEINWGFEMLADSSDGLFLNTTGESYFKGSIPGVKTLLPELFLIKSGQPDYSGHEWGTDQADQYKNQWDSTWVGDSLDGLGDFLGVSGQIGTSIIMVIIIAVLFGASQVLLHSTAPALVASGNILICSFIMGFVSPSIMAVTVFLFILFIGYILVFRNG
jgi:hypothetical protein